MTTLRITSPLVVALLPVALHAQDLTGEALVDRLANECAAFTRDAVSVAQAASGESRTGAVTTDERIISVTGGEKVGNGMLTLNMIENRHDQGRSVACSLVLFDSSATFTDLGIHDVLAARSEALLGGAVTEIGGEAYHLGESARLAHWATEGAPPVAMLSLTENDKLVMFGMTHFYPAE